MNFEERIRQLRALGMEDSDVQSLPNPSTGSTREGSAVSSTGTKNLQGLDLLVKTGK